MFFFQQLLIGTDVLCPVQECAYDAVLVVYGMVAVPLQILICMSGLSVDPGFQASIPSRCD